MAVERPALPHRHSLWTTDGRFNIKRLWARDPWRLTCRIYRNALTHALAAIINMERGSSPLQFDKLAQA